MIGQILHSGRMILGDLNLLLALLSFGQVQKRLIGGPAVRAISRMRATMIIRLKKFIQVILQLFNTPVPFFTKLLGKELVLQRLMKSLGKTILLAHLKCDLCHLMAQRGIKPDYLVKDLLTAAKPVRKLARF